MKRPVPGTLRFEQRGISDSTYTEAEVTGVPATVAPTFISGVDRAGNVWVFRAEAATPLTQGVRCIIDVIDVSGRRVLGSAAFGPSVSIHMIPGSDLVAIMSSGSRPGTYSTTIYRIAVTVK